MNTIPLPSHLRFLMAGIQDRALDLSLEGRFSVRAELDIAARHAVFELATRPNGTDALDPAAVRITADLHGIVHPDATRQPVQEALNEARAQMAAMLDHLEALAEGKGEPS